MSDGRAGADARVLDALAGWAAATGPRENATPPTPPRSVAEGAAVELAEVTGDTVRAICRLTVAADQKGFVAPNAISFSEALFESKAWYRAIHADGIPVGFLMLYEDPGEPVYFLWRLMVDARYQGKGYGARAMALLVEHVRSRPGATELKTSWVPGPGNPEAFYLRLGFEPTGEIDEGEIVARLAL
jgi:diamine N-acetyltransferase